MNTYYSAVKNYEIAVKGNIIELNTVHMGYCG
jgi:hypothetical protein